jgi:hypothetical protein
VTSSGRRRRDATNAKDHYSLRTDATPVAKPQATTITPPTTEIFPDQSFPHLG